MPRKDNSKNPLQIKVKAVTLPKRITPKRYLQTLVRAIDEGRELPRGWQVDLHWRNPKTRHGATKRWRSDDFMSAIMESRSGFVDIVRGALVRKLRRLA